MKKLFIESVRCGVGAQDFGLIVVEVKVRLESGERCFFSLAEVDGIPNFYRTGESTYDRQIAADPEDFCEELEEAWIDLGEYDEIFEEPDPDWHDLYRLLIALVRSDSETTAHLAAAASGKYLSEVDIPVSDVEEFI